MAHIDMSKLTRSELIQGLKNLAHKHKSVSTFKDAAHVEFPGVAVTIAYHPSGRMFMGMAMSHYHPGTISF